MPGAVGLARPWRRVAYADLVKEKMGADWYDIPLAARVAKAHVTVVPPKSTPA